jgi:acetyl esterase/lipase
MSSTVLTRPAPRGRRSGDEAGRFVEWYPAASDKLVVAIHGGYWRERHDLAHLGHLCADLAGRGLAVASLEYRRVGADGGGWPGTFEDIRRDIDALPVLAQAQGMALSETVILGHSAGGQLALWAVSPARETGALARPSTVGLRGVIALAPVSDLVEASHRNLSEGAARELLGGPPEMVPKRYRDASPVELLPLGVRTIVIQGTEDADVPYDMSATYVDRARTAGDDCRLVTLGGADHFELIDPESRYWPEVVRAIQSLF